MSPTRKHALLFLQLDADSFGVGRVAQSLVDRLIAYQRQVGQRLADELGAAVRQEYVELGSGSEVADFAVLMDMLTDSELLHQHIDYVIAPDFTYQFASLTDVREVHDAIYEAGAMFIPFRLLDLKSDSPDPGDQRLLRDLRAFYGRPGRLEEPGRTGADV